MSKARTNPKKSSWIEDFKHRRARLREILAFLDRVKPDNNKEAKTLTDEQLNALGIHLADLNLKTGKTSPSVTQFFMPAENDASGISRNDTEPINDEFTEYSQSRGKRLSGDQGWPGYLADAFYSHARKQDNSVFGPRWKQLM